MWVAIFIDQAESDHWVVTLQVRFNISDGVVLQVFFELLLQDEQCVGKVYLERTGVIGSGLHCRFFYQRISAEAHVKPLPNAAKQIKSFSLIFPSAHASLIAIGIDAAVVFP